MANQRRRFPASGGRRNQRIRRDGRNQRIRTPGTPAGQIDPGFGPGQGWVNTMAPAVCACSCFDITSASPSIQGEWYANMPINYCGNAVDGNGNPQSPPNWDSEDECCDNPCVSICEDWFLGEHANLPSAFYGYYNCSGDYATNLLNATCNALPGIITPSGGV